MSERRPRNGGLFGRRGRRNGERAGRAPGDPPPEELGTGASGPVRPATTLDAPEPRGAETLSLPPLHPTARDEPEPAQPRRPRVIGPLEAALRHPFLTILPILLLAGGAVYLGTERDPEYTAASRISVGRSDVPAHVLQNAAYGNQVIAITYSRAIDAPDVVNAAAREVGIPPADARSRLSASVVPESTLIEVEATGNDERQTIALANAGGNALMDWVAEVTASDRAGRLLRRYREAQADLRRLEVRADRLRRRNAGAIRVARAQLAVDEAALKASQLENLYRGEATADETTGAYLAPLAPAGEADSDRRQVLEQLILIAVAAGLVLGFALALLRANWRAVRAMRA
ncbi:MAG: hypothetical protein M3340_18670 [Actinomycetota bacterium]|nr:hypothetical protein [Actinomycetota bacterium]